MNSLVYIVVTGLKNRFLEMLRKPGKLILYLVVIAAIVSIFVMSLFTRQTVENFTDIVWLKGVIFAFILLFVVLAVNKALKSGDVIFDMSDVNFLFVSPIKPQSILLYGVVRMMGMSLLAGFFIFFQGNSLGMWFGIYFDDILMIFISYILALSLMQIVSLIIYSVTNGRPRRKNMVKIITVLIFVPLLSAGVYEYFSHGGNLTLAAKALLESPIASYTPVVGWASQVVISYINGDVAGMFICFGLILLTGAALVVYIMKSNPDYFEDVLVASETAFAKKRDMAEGKIATLETRPGRKIKVAAMGIGGKGGASAFFYKHLRESFRANRFGLWGLGSLITVASTVALAVFFSGTEDMTAEIGLIVILGTFLSVQMFLVGTGRGLRELYTHYIYLVPEPSFNKIVWSNLELVFKVLAESVVAFVASGIILGAGNPLLSLICAAAYALYTMLLIGVNFLSLRWTGVETNQGILLLLYMIGVVIILLPGIAAAIAVGIIAKSFTLAVLVFALWELAMALVCFALSKGILHNSDMQVLRQAGQ